VFENEATIFIFIEFIPLFCDTYLLLWAWGGVVVKALRYKSEGPGIDSGISGVFSVASDSFMCPGVDSASKK
jgi:hypothetical protein